MKTKITIYIRKRNKGGTKGEKPHVHIIIAILSCLERYAERILIQWILQANVMCFVV